MAEAGFRWERSPEEAFDELFEAYATTLFVSGARIGANRAGQIEAWMKQTAPWTDRTGAARANLQAVPEQDPYRVCQIIVTHGVSYGYYLETSYGGRWAIISRTIDHWGPVIWKDIQNMMNLGLISSGEL